MKKQGYNPKVNMNADFLPACYIFTMIESPISAFLIFFNAYPAFGIDSIEENGLNLKTRVASLMKRGIGLKNDSLQILAAGGRVQWHR